MEELSSVLDLDAYRDHGELLCNTYQKLSGECLIQKKSKSDSRIIDLYNAPFALVSHGTESDPVFNFGNQIALELFELLWSEFILLPSRLSAEPVAREERKKLLHEVSQNGYINNYSGVRITATGKRFSINQATVWNMVNEQGCYCGQAAMFRNWTFL